MITGFNTDVEHEGVIYHVQTEDKGLDSPMILSLVYTGGAILASKRAPYDDLIAAGFDETVLAERLQRQHKLICAAIQAGRIEDLKRMTQRSAAARAAKPKVSTEQIQPPPPLEEQAPQSQTPTEAQPPEVLSPETTEPRAEEFVVADFAKVEAAEETLHLGLLEERELRAGEFVTLRVRVSRGSAANRTAVADAPVSVKVLGTTFKPIISSAQTDQDGVALVFVSLPKFTAGRAALLLRVEMGGHDAELRRIIHSI